VGSLGTGGYGIDSMETDKQIQGSFTTFRMTTKTLWRSGKCGVDGYE
jgi:hypothetical protein